MGTSNYDRLRKWAKGGEVPRIKSSNIWGDGNILYSYGRHWPLAVRPAPDTRGPVLVNDGRYSVTTTRHAGDLAYLLGREFAPEKVRAVSEEFIHAAAVGMEAFQAFSRANNLVEVDWERCFMPRLRVAVVEAARPYHVAERVTPHRNRTRRDSVRLEQVAWDLNSAVSFVAAVHRAHFPDSIILPGLKVGREMKREWETLRNLRCAAEVAEAEHDAARAVWRESRRSIAAGVEAVRRESGKVHAVRALHNMPESGRNPGSTLGLAELCVEELRRNRSKPVGERTRRNVERVAEVVRAASKAVWARRNRRANGRARRVPRPSPKRIAGRSASFR